MKRAPDYLLIELEAEDGARGHLLIQSMPDMDDAALMDAYQTIDPDQGLRMSMVDALITTRTRAGELEEGIWKVVGWRRITDAERIADFPDLTPPNFVDHRRPRKRYRLQGDPS